MPAYTTQQKKNKYLQGVMVYFLPLHSTKCQLRIWQTNLAQAGGCASPSYGEHVTHIVCGADCSSENIINDLKEHGILVSTMKKEVKVVSHFWLSDCLKWRKLEDEEEFCLLETAGPGQKTETDNLSFVNIAFGRLDSFDNSFNSVICPRRQ